MNLTVSNLHPITESDSPILSPEIEARMHSQSHASTSTAASGSGSTSIARQALPRSESRRSTAADSFDVNGAYTRALDDEQVPHPLAAILALTQLMEVSTASTLTGLLTELVAARKKLVDTQPSLGVRAGCQLFERFVGSSGAGEDFPSHKRSLIEQGRSFCSVTAPECRRKIAELAVGFVRDDCVILTHSYSRTVMQALLRAHKQNKRIKVYVAEARPQGLGLKTHQLLTQAGIPCTVILDSSIAYILERVDIVLVGTEVVVESGGLVSRIGTSQCAYLAKAMGKPFYALAESYKFLRYYPLRQADLPMPKGWGRRIPLEFDELEDEEEDLRPSHLTSTGPNPHHTHNPSERPHLSQRSTATAPATPRRVSLTGDQMKIPTFDTRWEMTREMEEGNPWVDMTGPELIDLVITDLGAMSPTSVSQYLVALFSS